ncbi:hypothetical protein UCRNP2_1731 [Neofusicoccum parvum UCRNP2]|uniref:Uncharacterized protein n=1 Tax=Botryosphaeria parva (strain UCR-NP2) TaxID=1287680 RepID=R1GTC4_BOTPV|nr:hypothetical protein UCRNP2_1731 [Neofusicoccum parvum UCRNP2]
MPGFQGVLDKLTGGPDDKTIHPSSRITSSNTTATTPSSNSTPSTSQSYRASPRISGSDPSRQTNNLELKAARTRIKELEATAATQKKTIQALSDRCEKQGEENANNAIAVRQMYRELEAQTKWLAELVGMGSQQAEKGREVLKKFKDYRSG